MRLVAESVKKFCAHVDCMDRAYELPVLHRVFFALCVADVKPEKGANAQCFSELTDTCASWLEEVDGL